MRQSDAAAINAAWARHYVDGSTPPDVGPIEPDEFREAARIARELATAKVTPAHFWCGKCGANKPAHKHEPRPAVRAVSGTDHG